MRNIHQKMIAGNDPHVQENSSKFFLLRNDLVHHVTILTISNLDKSFPGNAPAK